MQKETAIILAGILLCAFIIAKGPPGPPGPPGPKGGGVIYTRWGKRSCPDVPGTEEVYSGIAAGSTWSHTGGGANYICMPQSPEYGRYRPGVQGWSPVQNVEYETQNNPMGFQDYNAPCAVCYTTTRSTVMMMPAKHNCPSSWTREYYGYLMSSRHSSPHYRTMFECVDQDIDPLPWPGSSGDAPYAAVFYNTEAGCGVSGMPCPPYDAEKELTCVVCTI